MLDLDDMPDAELEVNQPAGGLASAAEVIDGDANTIDTDEPGFEIEGEGDHETPNEDVELRRRKAAFAKQKQKAKEAREREQQERQKREQLEQELAELKQQVGQLKVGPKPTYESCGYDDAVYEQKLAEWIASGGGKQAQQPPQKQPAQQAAFEPDLDVEFEHEESVSAIKKAGVSDYEDKASFLHSAIVDRGLNPAAVLADIRQLCSIAGIDSGKAEYMIGRSPAVVDELFRTTTKVQVARILRREADKLKLRQAKKIDVKPEVSIQSSGSIDNKAKQLEKLRQAWRADPTNLEASNAYFSAKREINKAD